MLTNHNPGWMTSFDEIYVKDDELNLVADTIKKALESDPNTQIKIRPYLIETMLEEGILVRENFVPTGHYNSWGDNSMADGAVETTYYFSETDDIIYLANNSIDFYQVTYFKKNGAKNSEYLHFDQGTSHIVHIIEDAKLV